MEKVYDFPGQGPRLIFQSCRSRRSQIQHQKSIVLTRFHIRSQNLEIMYLGRDG